MANNRMYIRCVGCGEEMYITKYYPTGGWGLMTDVPDHLLGFARQMHRFLDEHGMHNVEAGNVSAMSNGGAFVLTYEVGDGAPESHLPKA